MRTFYVLLILYTKYIFEAIDMYKCWQKTKVLLKYTYMYVCTYVNENSLLDYSVDIMLVLLYRNA